jgi:hypothetical protein
VVLGIAWAAPGRDSTPAVNAPETVRAPESNAPARAENLIDSDPNE